MICYILHMLLSVFSFKYKKTSLAHITAVWTSPNLCYVFTSKDFVFHNSGPWMNKTKIQHMISVVPCSFCLFFQIIRIWKKIHNLQCSPSKKIPNDVQFSWTLPRLWTWLGFFLLSFLVDFFPRDGDPGWDGMGWDGFAGTGRVCVCVCVWMI